MSVLAKRLARLEGPASPYLPPVAVVSAQLPAVVTTEWAHRLLATYGWVGQELAVSVQDGEAGMLLRPTPFAWVKGDAERIWLGTVEQYPSALIMSAPGDLTVNRFEDEADMRRWMVEVERELVA